METSKSKMNRPQNNPETKLDDWNDRLEENLEPAQHNDVEADEKAKLFSEKFQNEEDEDNKTE
ncbi:MAG: hypothetical protein EOP55_14955 [Sphingobacteriales bacterium]|nr:MAG: hypothetical protein EOP55_14955 [Sphingobacteriales bacterium]